MEKPRIGTRDNLRKSARDAKCGLVRSGAGFFGLIRCFEFQVSLDNLRDIFFGHFHVPEAFRPNHHVGTERAYIETARPNHANLAFEVAFLGDFTQLFDDLFGTAVTARWAFTVTVVDADESA